MTDTSLTPTLDIPDFDEAFRQKFVDLLAWRRDVRRFRKDPIPKDVIDDLLSVTVYAPSVGLSQPWRFVMVNDENNRAQILENYKAANQEALSDYQGERAKRYASLKLSGMEDAPVQIAVFCDDNPDKGAGLGRKTMPETLAYSSTLAIHTLWLYARIRGIGVGWVSIIDPSAMAKILDVDENWRFIGYLCIGYPEDPNRTPELEQYDWEQRAESIIIER